MVRHDREIKGMSFSALATKYDVGKTTIHKKALKENWKEPTLDAKEIDRRVGIIKTGIKPNSRRRPKNDDEKGNEKGNEREQANSKKSDNKQGDRENQNHQNPKGNDKDQKGTEKGTNGDKWGTDGNENLDSFQAYLDGLNQRSKTEGTSKEGEKGNENPRINNRSKIDTPMGVQASEFNLSVDSLYELQLAFSELTSVVEGKYNPRYASVAESIAMLNGSQADLAKALQVSESTISKWLDEHHDFNFAWFTGRIVMDSKVAKSVYTTAVGYTLDLYDTKVVDGILVDVIKQVHVPPNPRSQEYWLNNRQPKYWSSTVDYVPPPPTPLLNEEELENLYASGLSEAEENYQKCLGRADRLGLKMDNEVED